MAVLSFSTDIRDRVSRTLFSAAYASLQSWQQSVVADAGVIAFDRIKAIGAYFLDALTLDPPAPSWEAWLYAEAVSVAATNQGDGRSREFRDQARQSRETALATYNFVSTDNNTVAALTLQEIRRYCATSLVRSDVYPSIRMIDNAVRWTLSTVWNRKNWAFRQRPVTLTIATDSTVTISDSVTATNFNTSRLYYTDDAGGSISWASADAMAQMRSNSNAAEGRPEWFRTYWSSGSWVWTFFPTPDQEYVVRTEALIVGPPALDDETSGTPFASYPTPFAPILLDLVLAKVKEYMRIADAAAAMDRAMEEVDVLAPQYQAIGKPVDAQLSVRDVNGDFRWLGGGSE